MQAQTYEITFLGQAGTTLRAEFDDCQVTIGPGTTTLRAELPDRGALSGLMERINGLGLDVIDVSLVAPPVEQLPARVTHRGMMTRAHRAGVDARDHRRGDHDPGAVAKLGFIADLISKPTVIGYMNGLALTILVGQLPKLFGFKVIRIHLSGTFIPSRRRLSGQQTAQG